MKNIVILVALSFTGCGPSSTEQNLLSSSSTDEEQAFLAKISEEASNHEGKRYRILKVATGSTLLFAAVYGGFKLPKNIKYYESLLKNAKDWTWRRIPFFLPLPKELGDLLEKPKTLVLKDKKLLNKLNIDSREGIELLPNLKSIEKESNAAIDIVERGQGHLYGLTKDPKDTDRVNVLKSLVIGANYDEDVIILDFSTSFKNPRVLISTTNDDGAVSWEVVADNFTEFLQHYKFVEKEL